MTEINWVWQSFLPDLARLGSLMLVTYLGICGFLYCQQTRYMFFPSRKQFPSPDYFNLAYEELWLTVPTSGEKLQGWWIPHPHRSNAPVLVYFHGNKGNIGSCIHHIPDFHQLGFTVVMVDYRGFGASEGPFPTEQRLYEDGDAILQYLVQNRKISPQQILVYGHSLGGAIAIHTVTAISSSLEVPLAGLVVASSFTAMADAVAMRSFYRFLPIHLLLTQRFDSINKVGKLPIPVLFLHGTDDLILPAAMGQRLFAAAPQPKSLSLFAGATHDNLVEVNGDQYFEVLTEFVASLGLKTEAIPSSQIVP
jgi:alpha-beta hydrolase superfamily lysophospholipase